ncbi:putative glutathione-S-transferase theta, GST [Macrophomina phaseolina]|uniref:glutathione transferase n=1 Tax=Macrophomina phaseolina TaxID=35725 RepID=A0ABQ8GQY4_9PEZI|nr:putative glutathione-S-transferase theta, GST [Macrophomina phaseolina]
MSFKLTGLPTSFCTLRPLLVLAEKGVTDFDFYHPDLGIGELKACNRKRKPTSPSSHLKYTNQGTPLLPATDDDRAWALFAQWSSVEQNNFNVWAAPIYRQHVVNPILGLPTDQEALPFLRELMNAKLDAFEDFSLIDICYMPLAGAMFKFGEEGPLLARPHVRAWWERVAARESWRRLNPYV